MTGKTHLAGGVLAGVLVSELIPGTEEKAMVIAVSAVAGLLPDIDIKGSTINKKLKLTNLVAMASKHRGFFHTPILYVAAGLVIALVLPLWASAAFLAGAFSHLLLDSLNPTGIMLLYPASKKFYHFARIKTGGPVDSIISALLLVAAALIFSGKELGLGAGGYINTLIDGIRSDGI